MSNSEKKGSVYADFIMLMPRLKYLVQMLDKTDHDTEQYEEYLNERKGIIEYLWSRMKRYAVLVANETVGNASASDAYADVIQSMFLAFLENIMNYDPAKGAPTTFFKTYFQQIGTDYVNRVHLNLTQYDAINAKKVAAARNYYESMGVEPDIEMLSTKTGLSQKVVSQTIQYARNGKMANVDDLSIASNSSSPEELLLQQENMKDTQALIELILGDKDKRILFLKLGFNEDLDDPDVYNALVDFMQTSNNSDRSYTDVARLCGMTPRQVKTTLTRISQRVSQDPEVLRRYGSPKTEKQTLRLVNSGADITMKQLKSSKVRVNKN